MNKIKKSLSVLLSLVMLFTTLCFFVLPETGIKANAAAGEYSVRVRSYSTEGTGKTITDAYYTINYKNNNGSGSGTGSVRIDPDKSFFNQSNEDADKYSATTTVPGFPDSFSVYVAIEKQSSLSTINVKATFALEILKNGQWVQLGSDTGEHEAKGNKNSWKAINTTVTIPTSSYPTVVSMSTPSNEFCIGDDGSVTQNVTFTAIDDYGVEWATGPSSVSNAKVNSVSGTTANITFYDALADYIPTATYACVNGNKTFNTSLVIKPTKSIILDNLFDYDHWRRTGIQPNSGTISDITTTGFTFTSTSASLGDAYTMLNYLIPIEPGNYTLTVDASASGVYRVGAANYLSDFDGSDVANIYWGFDSISLPQFESSVKTATVDFTVPDSCGYVSVRVDPPANGTLTVNNFRIVKKDSAAAAVTIKPSNVVVSYDKKYSDYTMPIPTSSDVSKAFAGWYVKGADGNDYLCYDSNGKWVANNSGVLPENVKDGSYRTHLFSKWEPRQMVLTFDNLFNFAEWKDAGITGSRGEVSDITDTGFTLTATAAGTNDAYTNWTPFIEVQPNTTYRLEADIDFNNSVGGGANDIFVHMKTADGAVDTDYLKEDGTVNGTEYYNTSGKNYIQFTTSADTASVSFRFDANNEGNVLKVNNIRLLANGVSYVPSQVVTYDGTYNLPTPTRAGYTFAGWRDSANALYKTGDTVKITEDKFLYSHWIPVTYTITLRDSITGTETTQNYTIEDTAFNLPSADDMQKESYTFLGWEVTSAQGNWNKDSKVENGTLNKNYGDVTITAKYDEIYYTITWEDWDGTVLKEEEVRYGATPVKPATDPVKEGNAQYSYEFAGWGEITKAYENKTYTAQYTESVNKYTVTWKNDDGTVLETDNNVDYGSKDYAYNGATPVKNATAEYTYTFDGWKIEGDTTGTIYDRNFPALEGNITFVATFKATKNKYTVTWNKFDGTFLSSEELEYGTAITPAVAPERTDPTEMYSYTFAGWENPATHEKVTDFTGITVTGDVTYQATYTQTINKYTVTFKYKDASGVDKEHTVTVDHGTAYSTVASNLPDYAQYYFIDDAKVTVVGTSFYHSHYQASWGETPETITKSQVFTAEYVPIKNIKMSSQTYTTGDCLTDGVNTQICNNCHFTHTVTTKAPGTHELEEISDTATCLTDGEKTFKCKNCDHTETEESPKTGHNFGEATEKIDATCTTPGMMSYKACKNCRCLFAADDNDKFSANGVNGTSSFVIPALEHDYDEGVVTTEPTCTEDGVKTFTCQNDKTHTYTEAVSKTGHSFTMHYIANEADCFNAGNSAYNWCENCGKYFAEGEGEFSLNEKDSPDAFIIPKEEHEEGDPVQENIVASDCVTNAEYDNVYYCTKCNTELRKENVTGKPLGHKFDKQVIDADHLKTAATCTSYAVYYYECSRCDVVATEDEYTFEYGDYDYTNHSTTVTELVDEKAATCCETGYTGDLICVACKKVVKEGSEIATNNDHSAYKQTVAIVTTVEANCITAEEWTETTTCEGCKKVTKTEEKTGKINALKHTGKTEDVTTVTAEATCCSTEKLKTETVCLDCKKVIAIKTSEGGYNTNNHAGGTYKGTDNLVVATCTVPRSWDEVTYCSGCDTELGREKITLNVDPERHMGDTYTVDEDIKEATCTSVKTWNEVTYCSDCKKELSSVSKTGEKNPDNHTGETELRGDKEATCKEDGYTGDLYWICCNVLKEEGTVIPKHENHTPGEPVRENEIPATETTDGQYDLVVYCSVCGTELSRETIVYQIERTITFILKDSKVIVKAFRGDTVTPPETPEVVSADGFYHIFMHWDKRIKPVTGDETYTAVYTEPCNYSELDRLEGVLNEIVNGDMVDSSVLAIYKEDIDAAFAAIKEVNKERRFRDISEQNEVTVVTDMLEELVYAVCPDYGATLTIEASSVLYTGRILDIKAVKMPAGNVINDAEWTSSDEDIAFFSNGKLYAIGTGTVTITAERGMLKATKVITVIEGGNTRGVNFTSLEAVEFIIEDYYTANDTSIIYWTDDQPIRFRVNLTQAGLFDYYTVYINGVPAEMSRDGYYIIPANYGDARVTIIGEVENDDDGNGGTTAVSKWSFWEWILSFFRKIGDFFRGLFG